MTFPGMHDLHRQADGSCQTRLDAPDGQGKNNMGNARVLITDDDDLTLAMLGATLGAHYQVTTTRSGPEALARARQEAFDLILMDVDMPDMDGYATCAALKSEPALADVPVVFLSAKINIDERLRGYRVGACDYLTKPFDVTELTTKIELAVAQRTRDLALNAQIEQALNTALTTADMYGEVGVVLELQRALANCVAYPEVARAFFNTLEKMGFEGCLRLSGRQGVMSRTARAECSALENSILDHIETSRGPTLQALGEHTCLRFDNVLMLIRHLPVSPHSDQYSAEDIDRFARARDNIALVAEGIVSRMRSLDMETEKSRFEQHQMLVSLTREALVDISAQQHANRMLMTQVFQRMNSEVEHSFIHLGLSETQEDHLSSTLKRHVSEALAVFDQIDEIEAHLNKLISKLGV